MPLEVVGVGGALMISAACANAIIVGWYCCVRRRRRRPTEEEEEVKEDDQKNGLSASDLEKLPKVAGKDLVLANDCAICLDEITDNQTARMIPGCNHGFHLRCADAWLSKNPTCPVCRAVIDPHLFNDTNPC